MSDLLSSASLILAVLGILYGLWYPEIQKVLAEKIPPHVEDRGKVYQEISSMIWSRSSPLTILALLVSLIYLRDTLRIFQGIITEIKVDGILKFIGDYDTVSVVFCAVEILSILIGLHALVMTINLIAMRLTLCVYNSETTPSDNLECKAVEKKHGTKF